MGYFFFVGQTALFFMESYNYSTTNKKKKLETLKLPLNRKALK